MIIEELVNELKQYLRIDISDMEDDEYLQSFCESAAGYIASVYRYHILDETIVTKQHYEISYPNKFYLPRGPAIDGSINIKDPEGVDVTAEFALINNVIIFTELIPYTLFPYVITYDVGIDTGIEYKGDIEHCVALAAWLYRTADKGLEGMDQISTGVKESVKMFNGIPKNITSYFETRQIIRL